MEAFKNISSYEIKRSIISKIYEVIHRKFKMLQLSYFIEIIIKDVFQIKIYTIMKMCNETF